MIRSVSATTSGFQLSRRRRANPGWTRERRRRCSAPSLRMIDVRPTTIPRLRVTPPPTNASLLGAHQLARLFRVADHHEPQRSERDLERRPYFADSSSSGPHGSETNTTWPWLLSAQTPAGRGASRGSVSFRRGYHEHGPGRTVHDLVRDRPEQRAGDRSASGRPDHDGQRRTARRPAGSPRRDGRSRTRPSLRPWRRVVRDLTASFMNFSPSSRTAARQVGDIAADRRGRVPEDDHERPLNAAATATAVCQRGERAGLTVVSEHHFAGHQRGASFGDERR